MSFTHYAVYGMSGYGKSTLAKSTVANILSRQPVIVFNPTGEPWPKGVQQAYTADQLESLLAAFRKAGQGAVVVVDEARNLRLQVKPHHVNLLNLGTMGRHFGFCIMVLSQYPTGVDPSLRWNCGECYCFRLANPEAAKEVWEIYNQHSINGRPVWQVILSLPKFACVHLTPEKAEIIHLPKPKEGAKRRVSKREV